tara:strand:- start:225 stop:512 length:288 start_codon:yes stop_codon:yes gene_type:complete
MKYIRLYKEGAGPFSNERHVIPLSAISTVMPAGATKISVYGASGEKIQELNGASLSAADVTLFNEKMAEVAGKAYPDNVVDWWPITGSITSITIA